VYASWPNVEFGGTGFSLTKTLPIEVEAMCPDYDLYQVNDVYQRILSRIGKKENSLLKAAAIVDAGIGRLNTGCVNLPKSAIRGSYAAVQVQGQR